MLLPVGGIAQDKHSSEELNRYGISFYGGMGSTAIRDEFISKEKYSGMAPLYIVKLSKYNSDYQSNISFEILNSATIKNYNISAQVTELSFNLSSLYRLGSLTVLNREAQFFLGPLPEIFIHYRSENIAKGGDAIFDVYSFATLLSLGSKCNTTLRLNNSFQLELNLQTSVISLGGKFIDPVNHETGILIFSTLLKNSRASFESSIRYMMMSKLSVTAGYKLNIVNMTSWDYLISVNENILISITYSL